MRVGLDIGSTTIKCVVLDDAGQIVYSTYERHYSHILEKGQEILRRVAEQYLPGGRALLAISGSAGMGLADSCQVPFVQEVFATPRGGQPPGPRHRLHHRAGRRGRQDPVFDQRHRGAHERLLRGRHRRLHRPDGHAAQDERRRDGQSPPRARSAPTPSPRAAACLPRATCSRSSTRARRRGTSPPPSTRRSSTRPSPVWRRGGRSRATCSIWAGR